MVGEISAQQIPNWSSFYENGFIWNPALTAKWYNWEVAATHRKEWTGFDDAPEYSTISFQFPFVKQQTRVSFGAYLEQDKVGPFQNTSVAGTYAYRFGPKWFGNKDDVFTLGVLGKVGQFRFNPTSLTFFDMGEAARIVEVMGEDRVSGNMGLGLFYISVSDFYSFKSHYYVGLSANQIIPNRLASLGNLGTIDSQVHATAHIGYRYFPHRRDYYFEPNVLLTYGYQNAWNVMFNFRYEKQDAYWAGAGLVTNGELFVQGGLMFDEDTFLGGMVNDGILKIGFKVDYNVLSLRRYATPGYEIYMAYMFELE